MKTRFFVAMIVAAVTVLVLASAASAHGTLNACKGPNGIQVKDDGPYFAKYGEDTPYVSVDNPVPLTKDGQALTGVKASLGDRPISEIPDCPTESTTTSTTMAPTTTSTKPAVTTTTVRRAATTTTTKPAVTTTVKKVVTTTTMAPPAGQLPRTGAEEVILTFIGVASLALGAFLLSPRKRRQHPAMRG